MQTQLGLNSTPQQQKIIYDCTDNLMMVAVIFLNSHVGLLLLPRPRAGMRIIAIIVSVYLLSVCLHISMSTRTKFTKLSVLILAQNMAVARSSFDNKALCYVGYFQFCERCRV